MVSELLSDGTIRCLRPESFDGVLTAIHVTYNLHNLSTLYQTKLGPDNFDERDFVLRDAKIGTPVKKKMHMTPFAKQGALNTQKRFNSHRVLSFETTSNVSMKSSLSDLKTVSPSPMKYAPTPMTMAMEMNNWI
jgi:hypothetical protein